MLPTLRRSNAPGARCAMLPTDATGVPRCERSYEDDDEEDLVFEELQEILVDEPEGAPR